MRRHPARLLAGTLLTAGAVLLSACGDDGGSGADDEYAEAMAESMARDEELPFDQQDIDCLSVEFVDALGGAERLEEDGITPEDLRSEDGLDEPGPEGGVDRRVVVGERGRGIRH